MQTTTTRDQLSTLSATLLLVLALAPSPATAQTQPATSSCAFSDPEAIGGAYRRADGGLTSVLPADVEGQWQIRHFDTGRSHRLQPRGSRMFDSSDDLDSVQPPRFHYVFTPGSPDLEPSLTVTGSGQTAFTARKLALRERTATFTGQDHTPLQGKLTLPASGPGPFKTVILVHGSDPTPSVDREWLPHLLAAHGIAVLVFDKRGTGCSKGQYLQHVGVLANDVQAAADWLRAQPEVDARRIGLAGFSQGGWVAPLAALKDPGIAFVAVAYGLAMSMADEDRLEAPLKLRQLGVDTVSITEFERLNAELHQLARGGFKDWAPFEQALTDFQGRPWLALAQAQPSWLGRLLQMGVAQAKVVAPPMFEHFFQPFYEPVPTLEQLNRPMLWLIAGEDIEAPPALTLAVLAHLKAQGKPINTRVFANADHGLQEFELVDGRRVRTKYADGYFTTLLQWIQAQP